MARKRVNSLNCENTIEWTKPGQSAEGYYLGNKEVETGLGKSKLHVFQGEAGNFGVYGSYELNTKLASVPLNHLTFLTFGGKVKIPGGKTMKKFDVDYDDAISIDGAVASSESSTLSSSVRASSSASEESEDTDESVLESSDEDSVEQNPTQRPLSRGTPVNASAMAASASRKSEIEAMLSKSKR